MKICKDCKYWKYYKEYKTGECENSGKIHEDDYHKLYGKEDPTDHDHLHYSYNEGGSFYPGANFGCIHWSPKT